tara:strand:- start:379 stop:807 length:429 start_codon:yes stop_codon:yes gene_type:complete
VALLNCLLLFDYILKRNNIGFIDMNKEIPNIVALIFKDPDPVIWNGFWLLTLKKLLNSKKLTEMWVQLLVQIKDNHRYNSQLSLNKYTKWELKAFVASAIKAAESNMDESVFVKTLREYMIVKGLKLDESIIRNIHREINDR